MTIDKEDHREILLTAMRGLPISGAAGDPELLRVVNMVQEIIAALDGADVRELADEPV